MSVDSRLRKGAPVAEPAAREFLRKADPVLARLIEAHPDFRPRAYEAGAGLAGWDTSGFESRWCPTPTELHQLQATAADEFGRPAYASAALRR